jgi:hypothetical protein
LAPSSSRLYCAQAKSWQSRTTISAGLPSRLQAKVDEINRRLKDDGFDVAPPERLHAYTFYVSAPGGFTVECGA